MSGSKVPLRPKVERHGFSSTDRPVIVVLGGRVPSAESPFIKLVEEVFGVPVTKTMPAPQEGRRSSSGWKDPGWTEIICQIGQHEVMLLCEVDESDRFPNEQPVQQLKRKLENAVFKYDCGRNKVDPVTGVIFTKEIDGGARTAPFESELKLFQRLCGNDSLANVTLVTTGWESLKSRQYEDMQKLYNDIRLRKTMWHPLIAAGATLDCFTNTPLSAQDILLRFMPDEDMLDEESSSDTSEIPERVEIEQCLSEENKTNPRLSADNFEATQRARHEEIVGLLHQVIEQQHVQIGRLEARNEKLQSKIDSLTYMLNKKPEW